MHILGLNLTIPPTTEWGEWFSRCTHPVIASRQIFAEGYTGTTGIPLVITCYADIFRQNLARTTGYFMLLSEIYGLVGNTTWISF